MDVQNRHDRSRRTGQPFGSYRLFPAGGRRIALIFTPHSGDDISAMLAVAGANSLEDLFHDINPSLRPGVTDVSPGLCEMDLVRHVRDLARRNRPPRLSFAGGGAYNHFTPSTVDAVLSRGEFFTAYTPYQPEVSQGGLQAAWEYQSMIAALTGLPVTNASLYDGASAAAEAMLMAVREKPDAQILVSRTVDPKYRAVLSTYAHARDISIMEIDHENGTTSFDQLQKNLTEKTAGVILQSPNYFGLIEDMSAAAEAAHQAKALFVYVWTEALSLALLAGPGRTGADIAAGEGSSLGLGLNFGGPGLGIIAARQTLLRKMPGRIVGRTQDIEGKQGFVLTLQAREQHIRRGEASSNVCSNHALCALAAAVHLATLGGPGLRRLAEINYHRSHYAKKMILELKNSKRTYGDPFPKYFFNEFVLKTPHARELLNELSQSGIAGGLLLENDYPELEDCLLLAVTEANSRNDILDLAEALS